MAKARYPQQEKEENCALNMAIVGLSDGYHKLAVALPHHDAPQQPSSESAPPRHALDVLNLDDILAVFSLSPETDD